MNKRMEVKTRALARFLQLAQKEDDLLLLLDELLTPRELEQLFDRVRILDCLQQGCSQRHTLRKTGAAIATISRGARLLKKDSLFVVKLMEEAKSMNWWNKLFWRI